MTKPNDGARWTLLEKGQNQDRIDRVTDRLASQERAQHADKINQLNQAMQSVTIRPPATTKVKS